MIKNWLKNGPPVYMAVASYLGITKPPTDKINTVEDLANFLGAFPGGAVGPRTLPNLEKGPTHGG